MNCYRHSEIVAVGICKNCFKAVCKDCCEDVGNGLACKDTCVKEVAEYNEMTSRAKHIYGISGKSLLPSANVTIFGLFALGLWGFGIYVYQKRGYIDYPEYLLFGMGVIFAIAALITYWRNKKIGITC